ncbi:MAG: DUF4293 domain-containing protein [Flavobacteriaceae bacterium]|nr:DUF4293 domain-containing protein [Flavobacteriaceae bacterium]
MIQRIQSLYLLAVVLLNGALVFVFPLWKYKSAQTFYAFQGFKNDSVLLVSLSVAFIAIAVLAAISLVMYKKRKSQFMLNRLGIVINLYLLGVLLYYLLNLSGEALVSEKGIGALIPIVTSVLLVFANKAIRKDEALVKSVDRLR